MAFQFLNKINVFLNSVLNVEMELRRKENHAKMEIGHMALTSIIYPWL